MNVHEGFQQNLPSLNHVQTPIAKIHIVHVESNVVVPLRNHVEKIKKSNKRYPYTTACPK